MCVKNIYIYILKKDLSSCLKYGMKLSEHSNISFLKNSINKKGILGYISPKDSNLYNDANYIILRIKVDNTNSFVHNSPIISTNQFNFNNMIDFKNYSLGEYINPEVIITSSILPESIFLYNKIIDVPLLVDNSKEFYLENILENDDDDFTFDMLKNASK